jgi:hypothetical protein
MSYTRTVDGIAVDEDRCRVSGQIHVEPEDAGSLHVGSDVMVVLMARVTGPTFKESKGEITRINVLKPLELRLIKDGDFRDEVVQTLRFDYADVGDDPLAEDKEVEPEIEFVEVEPDVPATIEIQVPANRSGEGSDEVFLDFVLESDDDSVLDAFIKDAGQGNKTPVGGGRFATGEEADRVREFVGE